MIPLSDVIFLLKYSEDRILGLLPWFMLAVVLGGLLQHLRMDVLTKGSLRRRSATAAVSTTVFGALTPFCACSIVPLIRSFLLAGVPVSVVMAFWIASPAMAPEIFGLTASAFGIKIAVARFIGAILLATGASAVARVMERRGLLQNVVRMPKSKQEAEGGCCGPEEAESEESLVVTMGSGISIPLVESSGGGTAVLTRPLPVVEKVPAGGGCCGPESDPFADLTTEISSSCCSTDTPEDESSCCSTDATVDVSEAADPEAGVPWRTLAKASLKQVSVWDFSRDLLRDSWLMGRWMILAVLIEAVVVRFVPPTAFNGLLGGNVFTSVLIAAFLSIPLYLNGISAIPIGSSLVAMGMSPAGLTTFMLAGAITTIPAMAGVKAVVHRRIFNLYVGTGIVGSILVGLLAAPFVS